jgi:hypothetical protein
MRRAPVIRELQPLWKSDPRPARTGWSRFVAAITNPDLIAMVFFCTIGFLITINIVLRFPDFGASMEQLQQFP